jgi:hypothetical protein
MNRFRIPLNLLFGGIAAKGAAVASYHLFPRSGLAAVLATDDPLGSRFANALLPLFFDLRGIAPPATAPPVFEVLLVIGFGVQCFILGLAVTECRRLFGKRAGS